MVHEMYLFEVKKRSRSRQPWDDFKLVATIPAGKPFRPLAAIHLPAAEKIASHKKAGLHAQIR